MTDAPRYAWWRPSTGAPLTCVRTHRDLGGRVLFIVHCGVVRMVRRDTLVSFAAGCKRLRRSRW